MKTFIILFLPINFSLILLGLFSSSPKTYQNINLVFNARQHAMLAYHLCFPKENVISNRILYLTSLEGNENYILWLQIGAKLTLSIGEWSGIYQPSILETLIQVPRIRSLEERLSNLHSVALHMPLGYLFFTTIETKLPFSLPFIPGNSCSHVINRCQKLEVGLKKTPEASW